jgi:hypothetical protein
VTAAGPSFDSSAGDDRDLVEAGLNCDRGYAVSTMAQLLAPSEPRQHRVGLLLPALDALVEDLAEQVRVMIPSVILRIYQYEAEHAAMLVRRWLVQASDRGLHARELDGLAWQLLIRGDYTGLDLIRRMIDADIPEVRAKGGALAALAELRGVDLVESDEATSTYSLLRGALRDPAARNGVSIIAAQMVDDLSEPSDYNAADGRPPHVDRGLLAALLNDDDDEVRTTALRFASNMKTTLRSSGRLLSATATSRAFAEHPAAILFALRGSGDELPADGTLEICEHWLSSNAQSAGDIRTAAAGDAYYVVDIVLAVHARSVPGSSERGRCLTLLDRLIDADVIDANVKLGMTIL